MNAAFLLATSVMLVGQGAVAPKPAPAVQHAAPIVASNCGSDCGCESGTGHRLRDRLRGLFSRDCGDTCQTTCKSHGHSLFNKGCDDGCKPKFWNWQPGSRIGHCGHGHAAKNDCNDECERGGFLAKLRNRFSRSNACCDTGCAPTGCATTGHAPAPMPGPGKGPEKIDAAPKKMPIETPKVGEKKPQEVRFEIQQPAQIAPTVNTAAPTFPSVEIAPVPVPAPRIEGDRRDPF